MTGNTTFNPIWPNNISNQPSVTTGYSITNTNITNNPTSLVKMFADSGGAGVMTMGSIRWYVDLDGNRTLQYKDNGDWIDIPIAYQAADIVNKL
jgi:hypothetical protein